MDPQLLSYYEAIEKASADMLSAARDGNWDEVVKLEGACVLLISQLKHASQASEEPVDCFSAGAGAGAGAGGQVEGLALNVGPAQAPDAQEAVRLKSRIMQRILVNDAEIRQLAEPWLQDLGETLAGRRRTLH